MPEKKHIHYFDWLRVIAAICVVYMHAASGPLRGELNGGWHAMNLLTSFGFTAVPLFFMMSGCLLMSGTRTLSIDLLLKKRLPKLVIPLAAWTVIALLWKAHTAQSFDGFFGGLVDSLNTPAWVHFWYMYTLIALYVISPILCGGLRALDRKGHIFVFVLALLPTAKAILQIILPTSLDPFVNVDIVNKLTMFGGHLSAFILGYYLGTSEKRIPNAVLIVASVALLGIITYGTYHLTVANGSYTQTFQSQSAGFEILLAACIFLLFKQNVKRESRVLKHVPIVPLSLAIYLMHGILLSMMGYWIPKTTFADTVWVTALNFVICFFAMKTVATIKPLCFIVTGMSFKEACDTCNWVYTWRKLRGRN